MPKLKEPTRHFAPLTGSLRDLLQAVREQGLEGLIAKRRDSAYEAGQRSGAWRKMRVNQGQEFVIGGYTPTAGSFDALIFGFYEGDQLIYVGRTRNGFTPGSRLDLLKQLRRLASVKCPSRILPGRTASVGDGPNGGEDGGMPLGKADLAGQIKNLRIDAGPITCGTHAFVALRKIRPRDVTRES